MNTPITIDVPYTSGNRYHTHQVLNQAEPASGFNAFTGDVVLREAIQRETPWAAARCEALGAVAGFFWTWTRTEVNCSSTSARRFSAY